MKHPNYKDLPRYKCTLNSIDVSEVFEVRSKEIIVRARNALDAAQQAQALTGRGVVDTTRLDEAPLTWREQQLISGALPAEVV